MSADRPSTAAPRATAGQARTTPRQPRATPGQPRGTPEQQSAGPALRITLLSRPGCHLCDDARSVITTVAAELGVGWDERDITDSAADLAQYSEMIPVTFVDGVQHDFWRVSPARLRAALLA